MQNQAQGQGSTMRWQIQIANRIRGGRAVGTDFLVVRVDGGRSGVVARYQDRENAQAHLEVLQAYGQPPAGVSVNPRTGEE